ncbi:rod shape-determining protein RodA [filamentous cyanobacterium LEGE 11480]|uniref:Peptidoglycan glycosyltransferase RodA n=1 Tax=Romeriopsis navalis LEGE 11480 TaxID=2777977 RepID=A0A928VQX6_9CYAN|nr:rod shape-determining protein RodA [Romeriopsis navalis]MBE9030494.1 rod shape-determining protein RodA [Romeriopsis navalis LEGE 11480]
MLYPKTWPKLNLRPLLRPWEQVDWWLAIAVVGMIALAGLMIRSTEIQVLLEKEGWMQQWLSGYGWQHWVTGGVGLLFATCLARFRYELLMQWKWVLYGITNLGLVAVKLVGESELGAQRWINILGFNVQPSEFAKLAVIIMLAGLLHERPATSLLSMFRALAIVALPWALIFFEPNLGTSLVFGAITLGMLYWGNANPGWLLLMLSPIFSAIGYNVLSGFGLGYLAIWVVWILALGFIAWRTLPWRHWAGLVAIGINLAASFLSGFLWTNVLRDYQKQRVTMFINPEQDPTGGGYHLIQSRIAIGAGKVFGRGLHNGTQTQNSFIPEQHTDFIFTAIGEELGFIGAALVLVIFLVICFRLLVIAQNAKDDFGSLIAIGVFSMVLFQTVINIGMTIGLSPVTGIPLPYLSYGRSALLMNCLALGIVESVANYRRRTRF